MRFDVIYEPKGPAREYSAWACNLVQSPKRNGEGPKTCSHGCLYCYNPKGTEDGPILKRDVISRLKTDLPKLKKVIKPGEELEFTFVGDIYDPKLPGVARECFQACKDAGIPFRVLTKNGSAAIEDFDLYRPGDMFGCTLTFIDPEKSKTWEPGAALPEDRLRALEEAHKRGIDTWASLEPVIDPVETLELIRRSHGFVDHFKVGKWNHDKQADSIDWRKFASDVVGLLESLGCDYYIKDDLKPFLSNKSNNISVPDQIKGCGFCLIRPKDKRPFEPAWQSTPYSIGDKKFNSHLESGGNYGVISGINGIVVLDVDEVERFKSEVDYKKFPNTFRVRTGGGGYHLYFTSPDIKDKIVLKAGDGTHIGELQAGGAQVVGPGCIHPSGNTYDITNNVPIAVISSSTLLDLLSPFIQKKSGRERLEEIESEAKKTKSKTVRSDDPFSGVSILDVINTTGFEKSGDQLLGPHPVHGSETGHNLVINPGKNSWWCGRCETGGGPALWLAVEAGIVHCDEAKSGAISGSKFIEVLDYAKDRGIIQDDRPAATPTPQVEESKPTQDELLSFTRDDFGYYDKTMVYHFSPTKAIDAVLGKIPMCATGFSRQDKDIYRFDGEIYKLDADSLISVKLRDTCGDYAQTRQINEVLNGVLAALKRHPVSLVPDPFLMPLQNGVVDLRTGQLRSYRPDDYFTFKYCAHYDHSGGDWKRVLWQLCSTLRDPRDVLQAIDIMTSMVLRVPFNSWCLLFGGGSNGKGNFEDMMAAFVGPDRVSGMTLDELKASRFGPGTLLDVDLLIVSEVEGVKGATNAIKKIATGEFLDSDVKFGGRKKGRPHLLTVLDANQAFDYGDDSFGRRRRTIKMDFPYQFGYGSSERPIDPHMKDKITSPGALSGIASIVIARAPYLIESRRIYRYKSISESEAEYEIQRYPKKYFVEHCISAVDYDDDEWRSLKGEGTDRLDMPTVVSEYRDFCARFNVPISDEDKNVSQELGGYIAKVFDVKSVSTSKSEGGKVTRYRYYPGIWLKKSAAAVHADHLLSYSTSTTPTTLLLQRDKIEIDISEYITTATTATTAKWGILSMEEIVGEICKMFLYISSCKNPQEMSWEKFVENPVVSVVAVVRGRSVSVCLPEGVVSAVVEKPLAVVETQIPSQFIQRLSELERKEEIAKPADLAKEYHIPEKDVCEMMDKRGWAEGKGGFWSPPPRTR